MIKGLLLIFLLVSLNERYRLAYLWASTFSLAIFLWGLLNDDFGGAVARAMVALAYGLMLFLTLDRLRSHRIGWWIALSLGLLAWWFWPYLVM